MLRQQIQGATTDRDVGTERGCHTMWGGTKVGRATVLEKEWLHLKILITALFHYFLMRSAYYYYYYYYFTLIWYRKHVLMPLSVLCCCRNVFRTNHCPPWWIYRGRSFPHIAGRHEDKGVANCSRYFYLHDGDIGSRACWGNIYERIHLKLSNSYRSILAHTIVSHLESKP